MLTNLIIVSKKIVVALKEIYHPEHMICIIQLIIVMRKVLHGTG